MRIIVCFLTFLITMQALTQESKHEVGLNAFYDRVNHDYIEFKGIEKNELQYKGEFSVQVTYNYFFARYFSIQTGLGYCHRGYKTENTDFTTTYIQLPLQVSLVALNERTIKLVPYSGFYVGLPLATEKEIENEYLKIQNSRIDFGVEIGLKSTYKIKENYGISIIPRFQYGFSTVYRENYYESRRNIVLSLGIGVVKNF